MLLPAGSLFLVQPFPSFPPTPSYLQVSRVPLRLFVALPGHCNAELLRVLRKETECVGDLKTLIITEYRLDIAPQHLQVLKLDGSRRILLHSAQTLVEAGIDMDTKLVVEFTAQHIVAPFLGDWDSELMRLLDRPPPPPSCLPQVQCASRSYLQPCTLRTSS